MNCFTVSTTPITRLRSSPCLIRPGRRDISADFLAAGRSRHFRRAPCDMPILVRLQHCVIRMYFRDHNPPHFHIDTPEQGALMAIRTLEVIDGSVDARALREAKDWAEANYDRLWDAWREFNP